MGKEKKKTTKKTVEVKEDVKATKEKTKKVEKKKNVKKDKKKDVKKDGVFKSILGFFKGVKSEMAKVVWPTKKNMVKYSIATIVLIIFFAVFFLIIMSLFTALSDFISNLL